jgi:MYXO-CTERM domain-containing protein
VIGFCLGGLPSVAAASPGLAARADGARATEPSSELLVVDARVLFAESLIRAVRDRVAILRLDPSRDGLEQIADALASTPEVAAVHLLTHGGPGTLYVGATVLTEATARAHREALARWFASRPADGRRPDVLIYGCEAASGPMGDALMSALASLTGADVAGSIDKTGGAPTGANWALEVETGPIEAGLPIAPVVARAYPATLDVFQVSNTHASGPGSLTQAVADANANGNAPAVDTIVFTTAGCDDPQAGVCDAPGDVGARPTDGTVAGIIPWAEQASVDEPLVIEGPGADVLGLDGDDSAAGFAAYADFTVRGLTLTGMSGAEGAAFDVAAASLAIERCIVSGNASELDGGALLATDGASVSVFDSALVGNASGASGGAIALDGSMLLLERSLIAGNGAEGEGGAIRANASEVIVTETVFTGNAAPSGGAIAVGPAGGASYLSIENSTLSGNRASDGGAIALDGDVPGRLVQTTVTANALRPGGSAECNAAGIAACEDALEPFSIESSIVAGNLALEGDAGSYAGVDLGSGQDLTFALDASLVGALDARASFTPSVLVGADPRLGPLADNGGSTLTHALLEGSAAIDRGRNPEGFAFDQRGDGFPRVLGAAADMGAFEWAPERPDGGVDLTDAGVDGGLAPLDAGLINDAGIDGGTGEGGDSGCGCSVPGAPIAPSPIRTGALFASLLGLLGLRRRRR